jgi:hypothetical protein
MKQTAQSITRGARGALTAAEILALREHRLEADLTYRQLADRIGIAFSKLHALLNNPVVIANDRTAFKVRRYLDGASREHRRVTA